MTTTHSTTTASPVAGTLRVPSPASNKNIGRPLTSATQSKASRGVHPHGPLLTLALLTLALTPGCGSAPATIPTSFSKYNSADGTFACDQPDGWEISGGGKQGPVWAKFVSGPATISIKADVSGSLMGDIQGTLGGGNQAVLPQDEPVHRVHEADLKLASQEYADYAETPTSPTVITSNLGPARLSEFTAKTSFGTTLRGYRVTILGHNKRVVVYCTAPDAEWQKLKPTFDQVLASLERGEEE